MSADRLAERLAELYAEARELDEASRAALLGRLHQDDPPVAAELERLLAMPSGARSPIDGSALDAAGLVAEAPVPAQVGPYRIVRELGRGGMGRVFLAEQQTPDFRRTVALKLIDRPGPDEEAVRRFRDEVRILASLEHPGIVRFLDGGRSPDGIWFLALEYVEGETILDHVRRAGLDLAARVRLFLGVVEAVAHAHRSGVVHRDLKPGNVLVDRAGRPRLLDFGISKLLVGGAEDATLTLTAARPMTPAYASPEQLLGEMATPASDVYSLGVMLFELLTDRRPRQVAALASGAEAERPSAARRQAPPAEAVGTAPTAQRRRSARERIDRELDRICLTALRIDPVGRFADAGALAEALAGYLARGRTSAWRAALGRAAAAVGGRGRLATVASGIAALAVAVILAVRLQETTPSGAPEAPLTPAPAVAQRFPFDPVNPPPVEESERRFAEAPADLVAGAALAVRLGRDRRLDEAAIVLGRLRQVPGAEDDPLVDYVAGELARRAREDQRALVYFTQALEAAVEQRRADLVGTLRLARGGQLVSLGQRDSGLRELETARAELEQAGDHRARYRALNELAILYFQRGELDRGEATFEAAVESARIVGFQPTIVLTNLAEVKLQRGRPDLAEPLAREALTGLRAYPDPGRAADGLVRLSLIVRDLGRHEEAAGHLAEAYALVRGATGATALGTALRVRGVVDLEEARLETIEAIVSELEGAAQASLRRRPLAYARELSARRLAMRGDLGAARGEFTEAAQIFRAEGDVDLAVVAELAWAEAELAEGQLAEAGRVLEQAVAGLDPAAAVAPGYFAELLWVRIEVAEGDLDGARRRLGVLESQGAESSPSLSRRLAFLRARAMVRIAEGARADAERQLGDAVQLALASGQRLQALELRGELARLTADREAKAAVVAEASSFGLRALVERLDGPTAAPLAARGLPGRG